MSEKTKRHLGCSYLSSVISVAGLTRAVEAVVSAIQVSKIPFELIAFRGMSGALVGPMVAARLNKEFLMVRKRKDNSHSSFDVEGTVPVTSQRYIIVDDFICSGRTVRTVIDKISEVLPEAECVGIAVYYAAGGVTEPTFHHKGKEFPVLFTKVSS